MIVSVAPVGDTMDVVQSICPPDHCLMFLVFISTFFTPSIMFLNKYS